MGLNAAEQELAEQGGLPVPPIPNLMQIFKSDLQSLEAQVMGECSSKTSKRKRS